MLTLIMLGTMLGMLTLIMLGTNYVRYVCNHHKKWKEIIFFLNFLVLFYLQYRLLFLMKTGGHSYPRGP